jgi:hypothetical protein
MELLVILLTSLLVGLASRQVARRAVVTTADAEVPRQEMAVIAAIIRHNLGESPVVVPDMTVAGCAIEHNHYEKSIDDMMGGAWTRYQQEMVTDFGEKNRQPGMIRSLFPKSVCVQVVPAREISALFRSAGWKRFRERYPGNLGIVNVSRVGFSKTRQRALIYMGVTMGELAGFGRYHVLAKRLGRWRVDPGRDFVESRWIS